MESLQQIASQRAIARGIDQIAGFDGNRHANRRPKRHEEREQSQGLVVLTGGVPVDVHGAVGQVVQTLGAQVHQQEGDVVDDIGRRQRRVELQGVEGQDAAFEAADVSKMQIAVSAPDMAPFPPRFDQGGKPCQAALKGLEQPG